MLFFTATILLCAVRDAQCKYHGFLNFAMSFSMIFGIFEGLFQVYWYSSTPKADPE